MAKRYAKGKHAVAECQRSGQKMRYRDLVEDGHVPGLLVHPDWWEPKHPQEIPVTVDDPIALYRPAPEISIEANYGDPEAIGGSCPTEPDFANFIESATLVSIAAGQTHVPTNEPVTYQIGQCIFVERDDATWFVSKATATCESPGYAIPITSGFSGSAASPGNRVYIGTEGSGIPQPPPEPPVEGFVIGMTWISDIGSNYPRQYVSDNDIDTWTLGDADHAFFDVMPDPYGLAYGNGVEGETWIMCGQTSKPEAFYSQNDGADWQPLSLLNDNFGATAEETAYSPDLDQFVIVGSQGYIWRNTFQVVGWANVRPVTTPLRDVCWAGTYWFATGDDRVLLTSSDSQSWSQVSGDPPNTFATTDFYACWANGGRLFAGDELGQIHYSDDDGASWTTGTGENLGANVEGIAGDGEGTLVAVGPLQYENIYSTDNGATWARGNTMGPNFSDMKRVIYEQGYGFIVIGTEDTNKGVVSTSTDGISWTNQVLDSAANVGDAWALAGKNQL